MTVTSTTIASNLATLDDHVATLKAHADALALAAVEENGEARNEITRLLAEIERIGRERPVLVLAHAAALEREAGAARSADETSRALYMTHAREHAARLLEIARSIDAMQEALLPALNDLASAERAVWDSLRAAGASPNGAQAGQRNLMGEAVQRLTLAASGRSMFASDRRSVADIAASAWNHLLEKEIVNG